MVEFVDALTLSIPSSRHAYASLIFMGRSLNIFFASHSYKEMLVYMNFLAKHCAQQDDVLVVFYLPLEGRNLLVLADAMSIFSVRPKSKSLVILFFMNRKKKV